MKVKRIILVVSIFVVLFSTMLFAIASESAEMKTLFKKSDIPTYSSKEVVVFVGYIKGHVDDLRRIISVIEMYKDFRGIKGTYRFINIEDDTFMTILRYENEGNSKAILEFEEKLDNHIYNKRLPLRRINPDDIEF